MSDENRTIESIAEQPSSELAQKAYRKALLNAIASAKQAALHLAVSAFDADTEMSPSPERGEILRDWRAGVEANSRLVYLLRAELDALETRGAES